MHRGVEDVARPRGVLTFVGSSDEQPERERELAEAFGARGVDGLVIVPCASDQSYLLRDRQAGTALVFVDRPPRFIAGDAVVSDNAGGARAAVEHLIAARAPPDRASSATACRCSPPSERRARLPRGARAARLERMPELERTELVDSDAARTADARAAGARATRRPRCSPART